MRNIILVILSITLVCCVREEVKVNPIIPVTKVYIDTTNMFVSDNEDFIEKGRLIYRRNCRVCHSFTSDVVGPRLTTKISYSKMYDIIKNINDLEKSGDPYTIDLLKKWDDRTSRMPPFEEVLSDKEMDMLMSYLKYDIDRPIPMENKD